MMQELNLAELDPGIRDLVGHLRTAGFATTDSGDGRSKPPGDDVLPYAHVFIVSSEAKLLADAEAAHAFLGGAGARPGFQVQATYDPGDKTAIVMISWPWPL